MRLDDAFQRAKLLKALEWAKFWTSFAKMENQPCYAGNQVMSWDWWYQEIIKVPKDIPTKWVAMAAELCLTGNPGSGSPAFYAEFECLWYDPLWRVESKEMAMRERWQALHEKYGFCLPESWAGEEEATL